MNEGNSVLSVRQCLRCWKRWSRCAGCSRMNELWREDTHTSSRVPNNNNNNINNSNNNNNTIWGGSVLTGEEPPPHSGELKHALSQAAGPTLSQLPSVVRTPHLLRRKHLQLNSDTNASNEKMMKGKRKLISRKNKKWEK